jgi:F-type H+-transporting ATPase subunit epsilon
MPRGSLVLEVRTPTGLLFEGPVLSVTAEDREGWFGIRPGRAELVALMPPGFFAFRDATGEAFVAVASGVLHHRGDRCRVLVPEATMSRRLEDIADIARGHATRRESRAAQGDDAISALIRELQRRLAEVPR